MGAVCVCVWWSRVWKWERIGEAVDLRLSESGCGWEAWCGADPSFRPWSCDLACILVCVCSRHGTECVGAIEVACLCTYLKSSWDPYIPLPARHHAGLVIETIIPNRRLSHMFVKVQSFFIFSVWTLRYGAVHSPLSLNSVSFPPPQELQIYLNDSEKNLIVPHCFHRNKINPTLLKLWSQSVWSGCDPWNAWRVTYFFPQNAIQEKHAPLALYKTLEYEKIESLL